MPGLSAPQCFLKDIRAMISLDIFDATCINLLPDVS